MKNKNVIYRFQQQDNVHEIYIYDEIKKTGPFNWETWQYEDSETSAKHFKELLDAIPEADEIKIYFNSNGGSVDQGTAIYNMLKQHGSYKTGNGRAVDDNVAVIFDVTKLKEYVLPVTQATIVQAGQE